jgi:hypothetical protein
MKQIAANFQLIHHSDIRNQRREEAGIKRKKNMYLLQGCQIFLFTKYPNGKNIPNYHELYQMSIKYEKRPENGPSVHKIYQHLPLSF